MNGISSHPDDVNNSADPGFNNTHDNGVINSNSNSNSNMILRYTKPTPQTKSREDLMRRLSEFLLRRSLAKIDLSQRGLHPSDARLVKMALLNNASLTVLKLGYNNLGDKGVEMLVAGIAQHHSLRSLDLGFNNIGDEGCRALTTALEEAARRNGNFGTLQTLYLAGNLIGEDGAMALAGVIQKGNSLRKLYLTGNRLGPYGVKAITEAAIEDELRWHHTEKDTEGGLSHNPVAEQLRVDSTNQLHNNSMAVCNQQNHIEVAQEERVGMQQLFLGGTGLESAGCHAVARLLERTSRLRVLSLPNCEIHDEEVGLLASSIKANRERIPLESLQLSFNCITSKGLEYLMNAIWGSQTIKDLRFDNNEIGDRGAQQLSAVLPYLKKLETLDVGFNRIKATGMKSLMKAVAETQQLLSLSLSGNAIDTSAAKAVAYALAYNKSLKSLFLIHCSIGHEGKRHISAGAVSNSRTSLREISGFLLGPVIVTLGFPPALEHWTNEQVLNFIHLMWNKKNVEAENSEERILDPLNFLPGSSDDVPQNRSGPLDASIVVDVARRAFEALVENGVDVFSRQPGHPNPQFDFLIARDKIIVESIDGIREELEDDTCASWGSTVVESILSKQARSFVAPPETSPSLSHSLADPSRKKRIVEWLCSNIQHLNKLTQVPFNSTDLWKLHHHYFTPVVNESGGPSQYPSNGTVGRYVSSVPEVSRGSSTDGAVNSTIGNSADQFMDPVGDSSLPVSSPVVSSLPILKRKVSYHFLGEAVISQSQNLQARQQNSNLKCVSKMIEDGLTGHSLPPKNKRARRNRTRISFLPRVKRQLDSYLDVCHEKALITMRQLFYIEQAILQGNVNPIDPVTAPRAHLCGSLATDAETIVIDMI